MSESGSESEYDEESYSAAIKRLKTKDPEFYQFLKENDEKLLDYDGLQDEEVSDLEEDDPNYEEESVRLTLPQLENLKKQVQKASNIQLCKQIAKVMKSAVSRASGTEKKALSAVDGDMFNETIKLCLVEYAPALYKVLKLDKQNDPQALDPSKSKVWKNLQLSVKCYLIDLLKLLNFMSEPVSLKQILKHIVNMIPFFVQFIKLLRILLKKMIELWSTSEESVRVTALLVIVRGLKSMPETYHSQVFKQMYFAFVKNSKFTSPTSAALIKFMRCSLTEVYAMNSSIAYEHCFIYLRQLCIHLRNAITTKKKEAYQTVYNWQYVHCLQFWAQLVTNLYGISTIKTLVYPLVQTVLGTINLIPTVKYAPLRFHLIRVLIQLSNDTKVYIPVAPIISGTLGLTDFNKKSTFTKKPMDFAFALKASKAQLQESGFKDGIISEVCSLMNEYFTVYASSIALPELALPTIVHVKNFLKKNKVGKYGQQLKSEIEKLQHKCDYISQQRKCISFKITEFDKIDEWESKIKPQSLPLLKRKSQATFSSLAGPSAQKKKISE